MNRTANCGYLQEAFNQVCKEAQNPDAWYVILMERVPYYGGPEEGGWWGNDNYVEAYQEFPSEALARAAAEKVQKLSDELSQEARRNYGKQCLHEMDWLEARGLEADYLPEPDGPSEFYVIVRQEVPENTRGSRHYE